MVKYDVIIVGGGHAGCEAAHAAARIGCHTVMITLDASKIGVMSCNPAIGGLAKGQLVKEIDALGGVMGRITDQTAIQYRRLNMGKGPAVRSSRAQCDKNLYAERMQELIRSTPKLSVMEAEVADILVKQNKITGVRLKSGETIATRAVVMTSGTFLQAIMHVGEEQGAGGRVGEKAAKGLSGSLKSLGFGLRRLKTGTPPRLHKDSIDWRKTVAQPGDAQPVPFSFYFRPEKFPVLPQLDCYITHTNPRTHEIIRANKKRSPIFIGTITGAGPRYCPSIEDKVDRFSDRDRHQLFLEPEGLDVNEIYVNGISTSLPQDVQEDFVRSIAGLERAEFLRHGYAVEYDALDARQLKATLESKDVEGFYAAGQVNGTSGYEEAGAQGICAGINAARFIRGEESAVFSRLDGYLGVMIDDLILKGSDEPYRMFTSRAEYRLLLREDNADLRLSEKGYRWGVLSEADYQILEKKRARINQLTVTAKSTYFKPNSSLDKLLEGKGHGRLKDRVSLAELLTRPELGFEDFRGKMFHVEQYPPEVLEQVEIQLKYAGYIKRDLELLEGVRKSETLHLPEDLDLDKVSGLSNEIKSRLKETRPENLGQMSRIQGVTPAAVANMLIHLKLRAREDWQIDERPSGV